MRPARRTTEAGHRGHLNRRTVVLAAVAALAVAVVHLGLVGAVLANSSWTGPVAGIALAVVLLKVLLVVLGIRHRRARKARDPRLDRGCAALHSFSWRLFAPPWQIGWAKCRSAAASADSEFAYEQF